MLAFLSPILVYVLKMTACSAILWLFYKGVVSKSYHLGYARSYLLLLPLVSILIPLISIPVSWGSFSASMTGWLEENILNVVVVKPTSDVVEVSATVFTPLTWNGMRYLLTGYIAGILVFGLRIGLQCWHVGRIALSGRRESVGGRTLVYSAKVESPFSFLSTIYLPLHTNANEKEIFIRHEAEHIRHKHSCDIMFLEFVRALCWFNPFFWKIRTALRDVHEYQVDRAMVQGKISLNTYKIMIMKELFGSTPEMAQGFGHSLVKKRILMLGKIGKGRKEWGRVLMLLPLLAGLMLVFCCTSRTAETPLPVSESALVEQAVETTSPAATQPETKAAEATDDAVMYTAVEEKPLFEGKEANNFTAWVSSRIVYPAAAAEKSVQGKVFLNFVIDVDGSLTDLKVVRSVDADLDKEALRVVSESPKWTPGRQGSKVVKVRYTFPVNFQLQ
jgi:TonB family C-terminal domain